MTKKTVTKSPETSGRRKFLKTAGAGAAGAATLGFPMVSFGQSTTLKMQSSWGAKAIFQDMAQQYADRVEAMSGGSLKIDLLPSGAQMLVSLGEKASRPRIVDAEVS